MKNTKKKLKGKSRGVLCPKDKGYRILLGANSKDNLFSFDECRHKIYEINIKGVI
jgi:hypothetical protein